MDLENVYIGRAAAKILREACHTGWVWMPVGATNRLYLNAIEELVGKGLLRPDGRTPSGNYRFCFTDEASEHIEGLEVLATLKLEEVGV